MTYQTRIKSDNGVGAEPPMGASGVFEQTFEAAAVTFRSDCARIEGTFSMNSLDRCFGPGQEHKRKQTCNIESDQLWRDV